MKLKVAITAGGTGGHLYPAQVLAERLLEEGHEVHFLGSGLGENPYFVSRNIPHSEICSDPLNHKQIWAHMKGVGKICSGVASSLRALYRLQPDVLVGFGSYHTFPSLVSAKCLFCPVILHEANAVLGRVNWLFSPYAERVALHFSPCGAELKENERVVGMPLRTKMHPARSNLREALDYFHLRGDEKVLLVFGGSQGAQGLNTLVAEAVTKEVMTPVFVLHYTGKGKGEEEIAELYRRQNIPAIVKPFETRIDLAWKVAKVAVTRAGASSIAERVAYGVPGVLIPFPAATDNHQEKNADALVGKTVGVIKLPERGLTAERLGKAIDDILRDEGQYRSLQDSLFHYRNQVGEDQLLELVLEVGRERRG